MLKNYIFQSNYVSKNTEQIGHYMFHAQQPHHPCSLSGPRQTIRAMKIKPRRQEATRVKIRRRTPDNGINLRQLAMPDIILTVKSRLCRCGSVRLKICLDTFFRM